MNNQYQKLAVLLKAAGISKSELAGLLGYKDQQSMTRTRTKDKVSRGILILILKVAGKIDPIDWTICTGCEEPLMNDELLENDTCPVCGTHNPD